MKQSITFALVPFLLCFGINISSQIVTIPDANFKEYLVNNSEINSNGDDEIQVSEAEAFDGLMQCVSKDINSLVGIEAFINLDDLRCFNNNITELDLSKNLKLRRLSCYTNKITSLDISMLANLEYLNAHTNLLTEIDIKANDQLTDLYLQNNEISSMDLTNADNLVKLVMYENSLSSLDVILLPNLVQLSISSNSLNTIDLSNNPLLSTLKVGKMNLTEIDLSNNPDLKFLECDANNFTELNLINNRKLTYLDCSENQLQNLDLDSLLEMTHLYVDYNQFTSLDLSHLSKLIALGANDNKLTALNVANGNNTEMINFITYVNPDLLCITVDDVEYAKSAGWIVDETSNFSEDCSTFTEISSSEIAHEITLSPNPVNDRLFIFYEGIKIESINIYDANGQFLKSKSDNFDYLDVSVFDTGLYTMVIVSENGEIITKRFVKVEGQ